MRAAAENKVPKSIEDFFVTFFSLWASYTKTIARNMAAIVTERLAVL